MKKKYYVNYSGFDDKLKGRGIRNFDNTLNNLVEVPEKLSKLYDELGYDTIYHILKENGIDSFTNRKYQNRALYAIRHGKLTAFMSEGDSGVLFKYYVVRDDKLKKFLSDLFRI